MRFCFRAAFQALIEVNLVPCAGGDSQSNPRHGRRRGCHDPARARARACRRIPGARFREVPAAAIARRSRIRRPSPISWRVPFQKRNDPASVVVGARGAHYPAAQSYLSSRTTTTAKNLAKNSGAPPSRVSGEGFFRLGPFAAGNKNLHVEKDRNKIRTLKKTLPLRSCGTIQCPGTRRRLPSSVRGVLPGRGRPDSLQVV